MSRRPTANWQTLTFTLAATATFCLAGCSRQPKKPMNAEDSAQVARADSIRLDSLLKRRHAYEAERAQACQDVYKRENAKFNNVVTWKYDQAVDGCYVIYKYVPPKTEAECDSMYPPAEPTFFQERLLCHDGRYRTRF